MYYLFKHFFLIFILFFLYNCTESISYSGKIFDYENLNLDDLKSKNQVINKIGQPNFIDNIESKYFYFSERKKTKNFFNKKILNRNMYVFTFDNNDNVLKFEKFNLDDENDLKYIKETTPNNLIKQGLIKKIFGGVGHAVPTGTE